MRLITRILPLLAALTIGLAAPASADAKVTLKKAMWGPAVFNGQSVMPTYVELGVGIWQVQVRWDRVATRQPQNPTDPTDPAYRWPAETDRAIADARAHGIKPLIMLIGAPGWANGGKGFNGAPNDPKDYARFVEAAAKHYDGVRYWMIWGEPNKTDNFDPPTSASNESARIRQRGRAYSILLDQAYLRLKAASKRNIVIGGNGYNTPAFPGFARPITWVKALKLPNGRPPRMDLFGHNPFSSRGPSLKQKPQGKDLADIGDTDTLGRAVDRYLLRSKKAKPMRLFYSEYFVQTDRSSSLLPYFLSREAQARRITQTLKVVRREKRIYSLGWFRLMDREPDGNGREPLWGLMTADGTRKPGFDAFKNG